MKVLKTLAVTISVFALSLVFIQPAGAATIAEQVKGKILLQVEQHGEAWYVNPLNLKRYYLGRPADAFNLMRSLGLGITDADLAKIPTDTSSGIGDLALRNRLNGRILLQVQQNGEAWYVNPVNKKRYYLGRPEDAFNLMRQLGLGITDLNLTAVNCSETLESGGYRCLVAAAPSCPTLSINAKQTVDFLGMLVQGEALMSIKNELGKCVFSSTTTGTQISLSEQTKNELLSQGKTLEEIAQVEKEATESAKTTIGTKFVCKFFSNQELAKVLNYWAEGNFQTDCQYTLGDNSNPCQYKMNGVPIDAECQTILPEGYSNQ